MLPINPIEIAVLVLFAAALICMGIFISMYLNYRRTSVVVCPETRKPEAVHVNARRAAFETLKGGNVRLRLNQCSRWPERENCGQQCLSQIENDPELCHTSAMAQQWFLDRSCVFCGKPILRLQWHEHPPALLDADGHTMIWNEIPAEHLPEAFEKCAPVCWSCHIAESFRRTHPELVVDRPWNRGAMGEYIGDDAETDPGSRPTILQ
jgi:hypothetical protein